jgi:hypothetical protein
MALEVEDGTGKANSNTYVGIAEARAYALERGVVLPADDGAVEAMLHKATAYLEGQRARYQGSKTWPAPVADPVHVRQAMQWPRTGVVIDCDYELPDDTIPQELKDAQMQLCIEQQNGFSLQPASDGTVVKKKTVDVIEKEFFSATELGMSGTPLPTFPAVDALLAPLFQACGSGLLRTVRV